MLRDREASLANAQRIANLGNWDLVADTLEPPDDWEENREKHHTSNIELRWSDELYRLLGFVPGTVKPTPEVFLQAVHPEDRELVARSHRLVMFEQKPYCIDYRIVLPDGKERTVCEQSAINSNVIAATVQDVTDRQRTTMSKQRPIAIACSQKWHYGFGTPLTSKKFSTLLLPKSGNFSNADRAFIGIKSADSAMPDSPVYGKIVAESVGTEWRSILGCVLADESIFEHLKTFYATNRARSVSDTAAVEVRACSSKYYSDYQIRATLNVPIVLGDELFGTLAVDECSGPRHGRNLKLICLEKLATQVAIALQQAQLLQQVKTLNANLESQVEERTRQLQQKMYELQESNRLKDLFLHAVSHYLRTPFIGMLILLKNLLNKSPSVVST